MVHIVTEEVDGGPVLSYCRFSTHGSDLDGLWNALAGRSGSEVKQEEGEDNELFAALRQDGLIRERPLVVETLKAIARGEISLQNAAANGPVDLTEQVEASISKTGVH